MYKAMGHAPSSYDHFAPRRTTASITSQSLILVIMS
jgi:hypothetical protein